MSLAAAAGRLRISGHTITITGNLAARVGAIGALSAASLLVARTGGAAAVGTLALLRVLPWFAGLLLSCGLWGAAPYFLSGPGRAEPRYRSTLLAMAVAAGVVGAVLWVATAPLFGPRFLSKLSRPLLLAAGITVLTQSQETTAKTCSQGFDDLTGSNRIIVLEELLFVPIYGIAVAAGASPYLAMIVALPIGDVLSGGSGWIRLRRRGYFRGAGRPSPKLARDIASYGTRAELNSVSLLLNGRLDFMIVTYLIGPAALGIYAVASRTAELLRLPSLAINYVLYPAYARLGGRAAAPQARAALRRTWWVPAALAVPVAAAAPVVLPLVYGHTFRAAVIPTWILLVGMTGGSVYGVLSAFLSGIGRPGLTSIAQAAGLAVTVALDLTLIPRLGIDGAATASTFAYLTTACVVIACFRLSRDGSRRRPTRDRNATDGLAPLAGSSASTSPPAGTGDRDRRADLAGPLFPGFRRPPADRAGSGLPHRPAHGPADAGGLLYPGGFRRPPADPAGSGLPRRPARPPTRLTRHPPPALVRHLQPVGLKRPLGGPDQSPRFDPVPRSPAAATSQSWGRYAPPEAAAGDPSEEPTAPARPTTEAVPK
jgi:O-antigen/teichoic acid export membrane protein